MKEGGERKEREVSKRLALLFRVSLIYGPRPHAILTKGLVNAAGRERLRGKMKVAKGQKKGSESQLSSKLQP